MQKIDCLLAVFTCRQGGMVGGRRVFSNSSIKTKDNLRIYSPCRSQVHENQRYTPLRCCTIVLPRPKMENLKSKVPRANSQTAESTCNSRVARTTRDRKTLCTEMLTCSL